jgi:hypothetical protein
MKVIIDIPEETYKGIMLGKWDDNGLAFYVKTGTPLDDVKAEIDEQYDRVHPYNIDVAQGLEMALEILNNIGKDE